MLSMYKIGNDLYTGRSSVNIIGRRKTWLVLAIVLMVISILGFAIKSPNTGIEFRGDRNLQFLVLLTPLIKQLMM